MAYFIQAVIVDCVLSRQLGRKWADLAQVVQESCYVPIVSVPAGKVAAHQLFKLAPDHVYDFGFEVNLVENFMALGVDGTALLVQHVVELQQMFPDVEVGAFDLDLGTADRLGNQLVFYRRVLFEAGPTHHVLDAFTAESLHQLVFQRQVELGTARVSLAPGAAPELVVYTPGVVMLGAQHMQPGQLDYLIVLFLPTVPVRVAAAEDNVGAAASHVGGYGDCTYAARLSHYAGFVFVILGVQHLMGDTTPLETFTQAFRSFNGSGAN